VTCLHDSPIGYQVENSPFDFSAEALESAPGRGVNLGGVTCECAEMLALRQSFIDSLRTGLEINLWP
jgi:hypothetical protein